MAVAEKYPLIRIPTQPARLTLFGLFAFFGFFVGALFGFSVGRHHFGIIGAIAGPLIGAILGFFIGCIPDFLAKEHMFKSMQRSSNDELRKILEHKMWTFYETLALLNLQIRGEAVEPYLRRILTLLESNDSMERLFARDALRLVFTPLAKQIDDFGYDPKAPAEDCRNKVAKLREKLN